MLRTIVTRFVAIQPIAVKKENRSLDKTGPHTPATVADRTYAAKVLDMSKRRHTAYWSTYLEQEPSMRIATTKVSALLCTAAVSLHLLSAIGCDDRFTCQSDYDCADTQLCNLDSGQCEPFICEFDSQCPSGQGCVENSCRAGTRTETSTDIR